MLNAGPAFWSRLWRRRNGCADAACVPSVAPPMASIEAGPETRIFLPAQCLIGFLVSGEADA
jgi:hypothetical protein